MRYFVIYFSLFAALISDAFLQYYFPGLLWIAPLVFVILAVASDNLQGELVTLILGMLVIDIMSGFTFGTLTIAYLVTLMSVTFAGRWIRIHRSSFASLVLPTMFATIELMAITIGIHAIQ